MAMQETWSYSSWFGKCSIQYAYTVFWPYHILRFVSTIFNNVLINISRLTFSNQFLQKFEVCCMNILLSVLQHLKGELFCKFCDSLLKSDKRFMVEAHYRSAKHQRGSFHETASSQKKF